MSDTLSLIQVIDAVKMKLLKCATPEAVLRLPRTQLAGEADRLKDTFFHRQNNGTFAKFMSSVLGLERSTRLIQVAWFSLVT